MHGVGSIILVGVYTLPQFISLFGTRLFLCIICNLFAAYLFYQTDYILVWV